MVSHLAATFFSSPGRRFRVLATNDQIGPRMTNGLHAERNFAFSRIDGKSRMHFEGVSSTGQANQTENPGPAVGTVFALRSPSVRSLFEKESLKCTNPMSDSIKRARHCTC